MSIRKTGSRIIVVDGVRYRWRVSPRPTYMQECFGTPLWAAVESADRPGTTLLVSAEARPDNLIYCKSTVLTPKTVAVAIRHAIALGWEPDLPGSPFVVGLPAGMNQE